jgi:hypothetical protein
VRARESTCRSAAISSLIRTSSIICPDDLIPSQNFSNWSNCPQHICMQIFAIAIICFLRVLPCGKLLCFKANLVSKGAL